MPFSLPLAHLPNRHPVPVEIRSNVSTALAASAADELRLNIRQPDIVGPGIAAQRYRVTAAVVRAVDQDAANAAVAHLAEADLGRAVGRHAVVEKGPKSAILPLSTVTFGPSAQPCSCDDWSLGLQDNYAVRSTGL